MGGRIYRRDDPNRGTHLNPNIEVGERIRALRVEWQLSQQALADEINKTLICYGAIGFPKHGQPAFALIEAGKRSLSFIEGLALCTGFGICPSVLAPWGAVQGVVYSPAQRNCFPGILRNPNSEIGDRARRIREDRDLSLLLLSDMMSAILIAYGAIGLPKYNQTALSLVESGRRSLSFLEGLSMCAVLRVDPMALAPWEELNSHEPWLPSRYNRKLILEMPIDLSLVQEVDLEQSIR